tara:strand:- start:1358 stop:2527 length:1170 start_codon:yes stop_codon:yes gene_type:complete
LVTGVAIGASLTLSAVHAAKGTLPRRVGGIQQTIIPGVATVFTGHPTGTRLAIRTATIEHTLSGFEVAQLLVVTLVVCGTNALGADPDAPSRFNVCTTRPRLTIPICPTAISAFAREAFAYLVIGTMGIQRTAGFPFFGVALAIADTPTGTYIAKRRGTEVVFHHQTVRIRATARQRLTARRGVAELPVAAPSVVDTNTRAGIHVTGLVLATILMGTAQSIADGALFTGRRTKHDNEKSQNFRQKGKMVTNKSGASVHHLVLLPHVIAGQTIRWTACRSNDTSPVWPGINACGIREVQTPTIIIRNTGAKAYVIVFTTRFTFTATGAFATGRITRVSGHNLKLTAIIASGTGVVFITRGSTTKIPPTVTRRALPTEQPRAGARPASTAV